MRRCVGPTRKFLGDPVRDEGSSWTGQGPASRARASSPCPSGPRARCPCHGLPSGADCGSAHGLLLAQAKCQVNRSPSRETRPAGDSAKWVVKTSELVSAAWFIAHRRDFRAASGTDHRSEVIFDHEDGSADAGWVRCGAIRRIDPLPGTPAPRGNRQRREIRTRFRREIRPGVPGTRFRIYDRTRKRRRASGAPASCHPGEIEMHVESAPALHLGLLFGAALWAGSEPVGRGRLIHHPAGADPDGHGRAGGEHHLDCCISPAS